MASIFTLDSSAADFISSIERLSPVRDRLLHTFNKDEYGVKTVEDITFCTLQLWQSMQADGGFQLPPILMSHIKKHLRTIPCLDNFDFSNEKDVTPSEVPIAQTEQRQSHSRSHVILRTGGGMEKAAHSEQQLRYKELIGDSKLCDERVDRIIYLNALQHGPDCILCPNPAERMRQAESLQSLYMKQSREQDIDWFQLNDSFWKNWPTGGYKSKYPYPQIDVYDAIFEKFVRKDSKAYDKIQAVKRAPHDRIMQFCIAKSDLKWLSQLKEIDTTDEWLRPAAPATRAMLTRDPAAARHLFGTPSPIARTDTRTRHDIIVDMETAVMEAGIAAKKKAEAEKAAFADAMAAGKYAVLIEGSGRWVRPKVDLKSFCAQSKPRLKLTELRPLLIKGKSDTVHRGVRIRAAQGNDAVDECSEDEACEEVNGKEMEKDDDSSKDSGKEESDEELEVHKILDCRDNPRQYLVWWANFPKERATWEPAANVADAQLKVAEFEQTQIAQAKAATEYKQQRESRIARNQQVLHDLGLAGNTVCGHAKRSVDDTGTLPSSTARKSLRKSSPTTTVFHVGEEVQAIFCADAGGSKFYPGKIMGIDEGSEPPTYEILYDDMDHETGVAAKHIKKKPGKTLSF